VLPAVAHQVHNGPHDGMVLASSVRGSRPLKAPGTHLQALLNSRGDRIVNVVELEAFRAMLARFGYITWTALLGGALFASLGGGRFHLTRRLRLMFGGTVTLHALGTCGWAVALTKARGGLGLASPLAPRPVLGGNGRCRRVMVWLNVFDNVLLWTHALVGAVWIVGSWRGCGRRTVSAAPTSAAFA
jgi:protease PrsW